MSRRKKTKKEEPVDRISDLPDEIIYHILQSLPCQKEAARTSVSSERWLKLWRSYPVVENDHGDIIKFERFAVATVKRLFCGRGLPLLLDSIKIELPYEYKDHRQYSFELYHLLSAASLPHTDDKHSRYPLKVVVKNSSGLLKGRMLLNCRFTKFLHLEGFMLSRFRCCEAYRRYNLQELTLKDVRVSEESFRSFIAIVPLIEKLSLRLIYGIRGLDISASNFPNLKYFSYDGLTSGGDLQKLQLSSAPLLHTLIFLGNCKFLNVVSAPNVKFVELTLKGKISRRDFDALISKLQSLESLIFGMAYFVADDGLRISALKLTLKQQKQLNEFEIDVLNLVILSIRTNDLSINTNIVNVASSCQCVVECYPCYPSDQITRSTWLIELRKYLTTLTTRFHQLVFRVL